MSVGSGLAIIAVMGAAAYSQSFWGWLFAFLICGAVVAMESDA
jgi:hypothetical protein